MGHLCSVKKSHILWCIMWIQNKPPHKQTNTKPNNNNHPSVTFLNSKSQDSYCFLYWEGCLFCEQATEMS